MGKDFIITKKNDNIYRKNRNTTGNCIYHQDLRCVCCNPDCVYNCSIDDELVEQLESEILT